MLKKITNDHNTDKKINGQSQIDMKQAGRLRNIKQSVDLKSLAPWLAIKIYNVIFVFFMIFL